MRFKCQMQGWEGWGRVWKGGRVIECGHTQGLSWQPTDARTDVCRVRVDGDFPERCQWAIGSLEWRSWQRPRWDHKQGADFEGLMSTRKIFTLSPECSGELRGEWGVEIHLTNKHLTNNTHLFCSESHAKELERKTLSLGKLKEPTSWKN